MRRRRESDRLERLQLAEDDLEERFIEYEEKPILFEASMEELRLSICRWSSIKVNVDQTTVLDLSRRV